jgi:putative transposase
MARKPRVEYPGAVYHVMARGNERARIFHEEEDYELFLKTLEEGLAVFSVVVHAYCLMPNHFHLALETPQGNLSRFMAWLQTTFTVRYNRKHRRSGHLFQGRYRAELVDADAYARVLALYIHLNPVRTKRRGERHYTGGWKELESFPWSSQRAWLGKEKPAMKGLSLDWLHYWGRTEREARKTYRAMVQKELASDPIEWGREVKHGLVAGGEELVAKALGLLSGKKDRLTGQWSHGTTLKLARERILKELKEEKDKRVVLWVRVQLLGERKIDLARELGYGDGSGVTRVVQRLEVRECNDKALAKKLAAYRKMSNVKD